MKTKIILVLQAEISYGLLWMGFELRRIFFFRSRKSSEKAGNKIIIYLNVLI